MNTAHPTDHPATGASNAPDAVDTDEVRALLQGFSLDQVTEATLDAWMLFIRTGLNSEYYGRIRARQPSALAAQLTLLHLFIASFETGEQSRLLEDPEYYLRYVRGWMRELVPPKSNNAEYRERARCVYFRAMRILLGRSNPQGRASRPWQNDAHAFIRALTRMSSSEETCLTAWQLYRKVKNSTPAPARMQSAAG